MKNKIVSLITLLALLMPQLAIGATSTHYLINADSINFMGGESTSTHYNLNDTGGEVATGDSTSTHYSLRAGYWPMVVDYTISISNPADVNMGAIPGQGYSDLATNYATWVVTTDNPAGYTLSWRASTATMVSGGDTIAAYTPAVANTPEVWSMDSTASEWAGHLGKDSTTGDIGVWGNSDSYGTGEWLNVATTDRVVATRATPTSASGDNEIIYFGAQVGLDKFQPSGTYNVDVTITAITL